MSIGQNIQNVASRRTDSILPHMLSMSELAGVSTWVCYGNARENQREPMSA